jgi:hypothetical protein
MSRTGILATVVLGAVLAAAGRAEASTFSFNFCPGNVSCNADLSEASITFTTVDGTADVNDYTVTVRFVGTLTNTFIDSIDFTGGIDLATLPVMTSAPSGTVLGDWSTQFDKISNGASNCIGGGGSQMFACSKSTTGNGPDFAGTNTFIYSVDFGGTDLIGAASKVDLRALFVNAAGDKVGAVMSPEGLFVTTTTTATPTTNGTPTTGSVPEPALLSLLGFGLAMSARRLRRSDAK